MDCLWRRTLPSVFILLSSHSVRVLCQNVAPTGPLPPIPLMREPASDGAGLGLAPYYQQMNLMQIPSGSTDFVPLIPCGLPSQLLGPDQYRLGPPFPQGILNSVPVGPILPAPQVGNIEPFFNGSPFLDPACNTTLNPSGIASLPQLPFGFPPPLFPFPPLNIPPIPNIQPQGLQPNFLAVPPPQVQNCNPQQLVNIPPPPGLPLNIPPPPPGPALNIPPPLMPSQQYPGPQAPSGPINTAQYVLPPSSAGFTNSNLQIPPPFPQFNLPPPLNTQFSNSIQPDLTTVPYLPPPNFPPPIPAQNYLPIPPPCYLPTYPPPALIPMEYFPLAPIAPVAARSPNFQIVELPPVLPVSDTPRQNEFDASRNSQPTAEVCTSPLPINLEINVPPPTVPEPKITVITVFPSLPSSAPAATDDSNVLSFGLHPPPPPLPPIIIESRSRSKSWLPLFLIALFAQDGFCDGGRNGCCCCCPCNSNNDIPIPFPIPIPTNNPIILGGARRSRNKKRMKAEKEG